MATTGKQAKLPKIVLIYIKIKANSMSICNAKQIIIE